MIIEQFLPAFHYGDAIGNSALSFHRFLLAEGINSRIIAMTIDKNMRDQAAFFSDYKENPDSIKILHFAVPSQLTDFFLQAKGKRVMVYHNVTPSHFFVDFSEDLVRFTRQGRSHLERLRNCFDLSIAVSNYNAGELEALGFKNVAVFPLLINLDDYAKPHSTAYHRLLRDERKNIIFVGRITPNKKIEDLIKIVFFYKKYLSPAIRLVVAGNPATLPAYFNAVKDLAGRFYLTAEDVFFTGHIPFAELLSVYKAGDVYVSMSEHEGFCLPLIESCFFEVPIIAYAAGAIPEILQGAGILAAEKNTEYLASLVEQVLTDEALRAQLKRLGRQRIETYRNDARPGKLLEIIRRG